jgi:sugar lactone lactonase YvrE
LTIQRGAAVLALGLLCAAAGLAQESDPAVLQFQQLQKQLHESHTARDWRANLDAARAQRDFLNGSPDSTLEVARAEFYLGLNGLALGDLLQYARMGQAIDPAALAPDWASLSRMSDVARVTSAMAANRQPIEKSSVAFVLRDPSLLPEDIDYDPRSRLFYVSSVRQQKIVVIDGNGMAHDFAREPDGWPVIALKLDAAHGRLWATGVALTGYEFTAPAAWGRSVLLCFDLKTRALLKRIEGPKGSGLGDMALGRHGEPIVSDGDGGGLYRLSTDGSRLERLDHGEFISPQTPAFYDDTHLLVPDYVRGLALLDLSSGRVRWLPTAARYALNGIDGMYFDHGALVAVQNGTSPERVVVFHLQGDLGGIDSERILARATPRLDPTHGVVVGSTFYYIANSGWADLDAHGRLRSGVRPTPARIMRTALTPR